MMLRIKIFIFAISCTTFLYHYEFRKRHGQVVGIAQDRFKGEHLWKEIPRVFGVVEQPDPRREGGGEGGFGH